MRLRTLRPCWRSSPWPGSPRARERRTRPAAIIRPRPTASPSATQGASPMPPSPDTETTVPAPSPTALPAPTAGPGAGNAELAIMVKPSSTDPAVNYTLVCRDGVPAAESKHPTADAACAALKNNAALLSPAAKAHQPGLHRTVRRPADRHGHRDCGRHPRGRRVRPHQRLRNRRLECSPGRPGCHRWSSLACCTADAWHAREEAHQQRVRRYADPYLARRSAGRKHPVEDFLFTYYTQKPGQLLRWHPGAGVVLTGEGAAARSGWKHYRTLDDGELAAVGLPSGTVAVTFDRSAFLADRHEAVAFAGIILRGTAARPAQFGCFGLHEWAMVYRQDKFDLRHEYLQLRLGSAGTDKVVEDNRIRCSHFDAFRFYTPDAMRAQRADAEPRKPAAHGTARVPARQHGPL